MKGSDVLTVFGINKIYSSRWTVGIGWKVEEATRNYHENEKIQIKSDFPQFLLPWNLHGTARSQMWVYMYADWYGGTDSCL